MAMVKKTELAYCCVLKIIVLIPAQPTVIAQNAVANKNLKVVQMAIPFPAILALPQPAPAKPQIPDVKPILLAYQAQQHITSARLATPVIPYLHQNAPKPLVQVKHPLPDVKHIAELVYPVLQHIISVPSVIQDIDGVQINVLKLVISTELRHTLMMNVLN